MRFAIFTLLFAAACGGAPIAANVPTPNKAAAAGVAAGAAAALTLADPKAAAATAESAKEPEEKRVQKSKGTVPPDVFDRLDAKKGQPPEPEPPPAQNPAPESGEP